jgi:prepilin-type N-terminal cleavage/methylation domain-containing protein
MINYRDNLRSGFSLIELLVVVGIISILTAMLYPAMEEGMQTAHQVKCMTSMRSIGQGFMMYAEGNSEAYPAATDPVSTDPYYWLWMGRGWRRFVSPYLGENLEILFCPSDPTAKKDWESTSFG